VCSSAAEHPAVAQQHESIAECLSTHHISHARCRGEPSCLTAAFAGLQMTKGNVGSLLVFDPSKLRLESGESSDLRSASSEAVVGIVTERGGCLRFDLPARPPRCMWLPCSV